MAASCWRNANVARPTCTARGSPPQAPGQHLHGLTRQQKAISSKRSSYCAHAHPAQATTRTTKRRGANLIRPGPKVAEENAGATANVTATCWGTGGGFVHYFRWG